MHTYVRAWKFKSPLSPDRILAKLNRGPSRWVEGDSAHSDYIGGKLTKEAAARIYETGDHYVVNLRFVSKEGDAAAQLEHAKEILLEKVLPEIDATDVEPSDPHE